MAVTINAITTEFYSYAQTKGLVTTNNSETRKIVSNYDKQQPLMKIFQSLLNKRSLHDTGRTSFD